MPVDVRLGRKAIARPGGYALSFDEVTNHAWVYGFVVGAAHMSEERFARVNAETVDAWMDAYCAKNPRVTIGYAAAFLVEDLSRMR